MEILVKSIETTISGKNFNELEEIWNYIKSFRRKLKLHLNADEEAELVKSINEQKKNNNYILSKGDIEDYFPNGFKTKNLVQVIKLLQGQNYVDWKKTEEYKELYHIIEEILIKSKIKSA